MENDGTGQQELQKLRDFIDSNPDLREQKRALAVMMWLEGLPSHKIQKILNVSAAFVSRYKIRFIEDGVEGLKLRYTGSKGYLSPEERLEVIKHLESQNYWSLQELEVLVNSSLKIPRSS